MKSINLREASIVCKQFRGDLDTINPYLTHMSQRECKLKSIEVDTFIRFADRLELETKDSVKYNGFHMNYIIPQIGKEFDIVRVSNYQVLNIELKSTMTENYDEKLNQNEYYFSVMDTEIIIYVYIMDEDKLYKYVDEQLLEVDFEELVDIIEYENVDTVNDLNEIFKVSNFLVSPLNSTIKFLNGNYFLTDGQAYVKKKIMKNLADGEKFIAIDAKAGTGKTLLLYDIALDLAVDKKVLIVHCANLCDGHRIINREVENITIISAKAERTFSKHDDYDYILLDEAHRFYRRQLGEMIDYIEKSNVQSIFSLDDEQRLALSEVKFGNSMLIKEKSEENVYKLKGKIRTNKEIGSFIVGLFDLSRSGNNYRYSNIELVFAESHKKARNVIDSYISNNYTFISLTPSVVVESNLNILNYGLSSHAVIGQEFDNVVTYINQYFSYDEEGQLRYKRGPNPDHVLTKLLYQNLTRVREKLCIVVVGNKKVFMTLLNLLTKNK